MILNGQLSLKRKNEALQILKSLLCCLRSLNADIFYVALGDAGFSDDERGRAVGSSFRKASARHWLKRTPFCVPSCRNHSNLQTVWISCLFERSSAGGEQAEREICKAYSFWKARGLPPPDKLADKWLET